MKKQKKKKSHKLSSYQRKVYPLIGKKRPIVLQPQSVLGNITNTPQPLYGMITENQTEKLVS